jgi:DHA2 family multidrug resistance protein
LSARGTGAIPGTRRDPPIAMITITVMLGLIMAIIDATIVNVALNEMAGTLGATTDEIAWVATGYILANVIIMPLNGWLTALLGRRTYYATCLVIFTVSSLFCALATSVTALVIFRVIQGFGGGALQPTAQAILFESFPAEKRGQAMAFFGIGAMVGPAIGPTLGGYIVDNFSWPLIFAINIPIGILAFFMTLAYIRDPSYIKKPERGIDWLGLGAMTAGVASLQYVLERGQHDDWFNSATITLLLVVGVFALGFFIRREVRDPHPFVDLRLFKGRSFAAGNLIGVVSGFGLFGLNLVLPLFFQRVLGFDAWQTGLALLPGAIATAISMPLAARAAALIDPRYVIAGGLGIFAVSAWWMGDLNQYAGYWDVFWPRAVQGFALGFLFVPLTTATLSGIERSGLANATGISTLVRQLGGSLGIAILQVIQERREATAHALLAGTVTRASPGVAPLLTGPGDHSGILAQINAMVVQNAAVISYDYLFRLTAIIFVLTIPLVMLLRPPSHEVVLDAPPLAE